MIIPNDSKVQIVKYTPRFSAICSVGDAPFYGTIIVEYEPDAWLLEFEGFEKWLLTLANERMTIEDLCTLVADKLIEVLGDIRLLVEIRAETTVHAPVSAVIKR